MEDITVKSLMEAGLHFGHQTKRWNPKMRKYIFDSRNGIYIIDLQKTQRLFKSALEFVRKVSASGEKILFIGTKPQAQEIIYNEAARCGMPYVKERWLGGMLTNYDTVKKSVARLRQLEGMEEDGSFKVLVKKEVIRLQKEKDKLERNLGGLKDMGALPAAVFIVDTKKERIALAEAIKLRIPVIAIVDTNCDPDGIKYIIPGNDDATRSITMVARSVADAIAEGASEHEMKAKAAAEEKERAAAEKKKKEKEAKEAAAAAKAESKKSVAAEDETKEASAE